MQYLNQLVGQASLKKRLQIYQKSYRNDGYLKFLIFVGSRGSGKTKFIREFRETLVRPSGETPPILEINCASMKSAESFFDNIYPILRRKNPFVFFDEAHELPEKLAQIFLTVLEKDKNPVRRVSYDHKDEGLTEYEFDFRKMSFVFATTDHQKMPDPLLDRLTTISIEPYTEDDLMTIFVDNLNCQVSDLIHDDIKIMFRGHPRAAVEMANELDHYASAHNITHINRNYWYDFCETMGIHPYGLNNSEMQIIKVLGERRQESLNGLSAATGFSKSVIQNKYEHSLLLKGLLMIDGKRSLTAKGVELYTAAFLGPKEDVEPERTTTRPVEPQREPEPYHQPVTQQISADRGHPLYS